MSGVPFSDGVGVGLSVIGKLRPLVGRNVGCVLGLEVGMSDGGNNCFCAGAIVALLVGKCEGSSVEIDDGLNVGILNGAGLALSDDTNVALLVGWSVRTSVGSKVGWLVVRDGNDVVGVNVGWLEGT